MPDRDIHYWPRGGGGEASQWRICPAMQAEHRVLREARERVPVEPDASWVDAGRARDRATRGMRPKTTTDVTRVTCAECRALIREAVTW